MTRRHWYLFALWLPLIVLSIVSIGEALLATFWWHQMSRATGYLILAGMMGGIQYLLFAGFITWKFHGMSSDFLAKLSMVLPLMFFPVCFFGLWVFFQSAELSANKEDYYTDVTVQDSIMAASVKLGVYFVAGCYFYVACVHILGWVLEQLRLIRADAA
ncbi:MAG: hypothetical protein EBV03_00625 [Proteobacteria bacterium]|nr:hypothetical protein [Pseudomonadota bacterium]